MRESQSISCTYHCILTVFSTHLQTSQGDWEIFTCHMASIFSLILQHMSGDKHTVQAMFNTLPYTDPTAWGRVRNLGLHPTLQHMGEGKDPWLASHAAPHGGGSRFASRAAL